MNGQPNKGLALGLSGQYYRFIIIKYRKDLKGKVETRKKRTQPQNKECFLIKNYKFKGL